MTIDGIAAQIARAHLCGSLGFADQGCGNSNDLVLGAPLEQGRVYTARCDPAARTLVIA
jgi:hypothetical protein